MSLNDVPVILTSAVLVAGLYATMSYGLALIYGVMKIVNLAHAGVIMLGAYLAYTLITGLSVNPFLAPLLVTPILFLFGMALQRFIVRRLPQGVVSTHSLLLLFGIWLVIQNVAYLIWTGDIRSVNTPYTFITYHVGPVPVALNRLVVFVVGVLALVLLQLFLSRTYAGKAIRAVSQDRESARLVGINTDRISMITFGLGIGLAGLAGSLMALIYAFDPDFGRSQMLKSFCVIVLGGLESFVGVAIGALVLAIVEAFSIFWIKPALQDFVSFVILVVVLIIMPNGLISLLRRH